MKSNLLLTETMQALLCLHWVFASIGTNATYGYALRHTILNLQICIFAQKAALTSTSTTAPEMNQLFHFRRRRQLFFVCFLSPPL